MKEEDDKILWWVGWCVFQVMFFQLGIYAIHCEENPIIPSCSEPCTLGIIPINVCLYAKLLMFLMAMVFSMTSLAWIIGLPAGGKEI